MIRARCTLPALLAAAFALLLAAPAGAKPKPVKPPAEVEVGDAALGATALGRPSILIPVRYPIEMAGRRAKLRVQLLDGGMTLRRRTIRERLSAGGIRRPDRRDRFTYVHRFDLGPKLAKRVGGGLRVRVDARAFLDVEGDGRPELRSRDREIGLATDPAGSGQCSSLPRRQVKPGRKVVVRLPACGSERNWDFVEIPRRGKAVTRDDRLVYHPPKRFRGTETIELVGLYAGPRGASQSDFDPLAFVEFPVTVAAESGLVVRALGDSVTAGFGYYDDGSSMTIGRLLECRPAAKEFNDACSSNSLTRVSKEGKVEYAADYGLANNVSWAAQWASSHGVTDFKNFAISGSEPKNWAPGGEFHSTTEQIESEDPDYILMTMGANPLLSEMLFGVDNMGCAVEADIVGGYRECVEAAFAEVHLQENLRSLYTDLVKNTQATIFLMQYHLSVPSTALAYSATQIAMMGKLLNREIASVAAEVGSKQLQVVAPPHFDVGIDISPVFPSRYSCSRLGYKVDGPSVQSTPTQDELEVLHPLSFCEGPAGGGPPWVISGDTGIHPSAAGYAQMASQVPPPE
ncbi:MAG TPA: SGNH/GDSL hydrolase family protein [Solirubrobacterales bacterium]|nr:SGNH/GDSL hydrolase family protein [Solirubrobacterales bacterium]